MKKLFAGMSAVAMTLTQVGTVFAAYSDVPAGVWYEDAVKAFVDAGYLDSSQTQFRGGDNANRAEFIKLVVELNGGILSTAPAVPSFDDVKPGAWYYGYFEEAGKEGWVTGDNKCYGSHPCYARPGDNINRAEAASIIVRAFGLDSTGEAPQFVDNPSGQWYTDAIQTAADHCVLQGDDSTGRVRPSDNMNRAEMVVMLHRVDMNMSYSDCASSTTPGPTQAGIKDVTPTDATTLEVEFNTPVDQTSATTASMYMVTGSSQITVSSVKWVDSKTVDLTLGSTTTANADYTLSVQDMMAADGTTFSDTASFKGFSAIPQGNGTLEVAVASSNPVGDTVPKGANGVVMLSLDLSASCDDAVTISDLTILHEGFGDATDIDGVYATIDGARVSRKRTIDSQDQTSDLRFTTPLTIAACGTKTVDIVADFNSTATTAAEHDLSVELASDVMSNAKAVTGNFPMRGNSFKVAAVTSGQVSIAYRSVTPTKVEVGDKDKVLGKFEVSTNSVEDQTIYSMTLKNEGSSKTGSLSNVKIRRTDGTVLTNTVDSMDGDYATFVFDPPFTVLQGDKITLEVVGDVTGGAGDTVQLDFEETSDLFAVGSLYGYGVNGQLYGSQVNIDSTTTATPVTIDAGQFTVEIDGPVQQKYTRTTKDAVLANVNLTTGGDTIDVRKMYVAIEGQTSTGAGLGSSNINDVLTNVKLRNKTTGQSISAVRLTNQGTSTTGDFFTSSTKTFQIYRFDDFTVTGQENWEMDVDFINNGSNVHPLSGDKFRVDICGEPQKVLDSSNALTTNTTGCDFGGLITASTNYQMEVEGLSTGDKVGDVRPRGTITGNFHRIATPQLTVAVQSIGNTDTAVKNSKNVNLLRFQARAGEAQDVLFTKAIFTAGSGSLLNGQNYTLWVDTDGDGTVDTILQSGVASQAGQISFDDLAGGGYVIPAEETVIFEVHADIAASLTSSVLRIRFDTGTSTTYLEAEQADDGSSLSGISTNGTCASSCDIIVSTAESKLYSLVSQGDLFVTKSSTPVRSRQLLGGTVGDPILRLQFRAQNEDIDVTNLQLNSSGSTASSIERLDLYKDGETTPFASATTGGCGSDDVLTTNNGNGGAAIVAFCASMQSRQLVITKGQNLDVLVYPRVKTDDQGATSNQTIQLWVTKQAVSNNTTGSGAIRARGSQSSNNLNANNGDANAQGEVFIGTDTPGANQNIIGNVNKTVLAKFTQIVNANPDADNTNVPTGVSPFGQFKFTAATNTNILNGLNKAVLSGVIFNVNATNVTMSPTAFFFYNKSDTSAKNHCTPFYTDGTTQIGGTASGSFLVICRNLASTTLAPTGSGVNTKLSSGDSATFVLEGNITNAKVSSAANSTLQATFQDFTNLANTTFSGTGNKVIWADQDTATTTFTWIEYPDTVVKSTSYKS